MTDQWVFGTPEYTPGRGREEKEKKLRFDFSNAFTSSFRDESGCQGDKDKAENGEEGDRRGSGQILSPRRELSSIIYTI